MKHLCDSNFFIALTLEAHPHRALAVEWLEQRPEEDLFYFCRSSQQSYLRLLTVVEWMKEDVCSNTEALNAYKKLRSDSRIGFLADEPVGLERQWFEYARGAQPSPKKWMDAYLAALARCAGMALVTFDRGFHQFSDVEILILGPPGAHGQQGV